jgi:putative endonuclease
MLMKMENTWHLYILRCKDGTLYTGITTDVEKRFQAHQSGKGAKYTRGRTPLELVYREECGTHSDALKRECAVKALTREQKQALVARMQNKKNPPYESES